MDKAKMNVWRLQTRQDTDLKFVLKNLKQSDLINGYRVDRNHMNMVQMHQASHFVLVEDEAALLELFHPNIIAYTRVSEYLQTGVMPPPKAPESSEKGAESSSAKMDTN